MFVYPLVHLRNDRSDLAGVYLYFVHAESRLESEEAPLSPLQALPILLDSHLQDLCLPAQQLNLPLQSGMLNNQPLK